MSITEDLLGEKTTILLMHSLDYGANTVDVGKILSGRNVCYVTFNKTYPAIAELYKSKKINVSQFLFIDAISKSIKKKVNETGYGQAIFLKSPGAFTELSLIISKALNHDFDYFVFDAVTNLSTYKNNKIVEKFLCDLINKVKLSKKTKGIFYIIHVKEQESIIKKAEMFVDKIVDLGNEDLKKKAIEKVKK